MLMIYSLLLTFLVWFTVRIKYLTQQITSAKLFCFYFPLGHQHIIFTHEITPGHFVLYNIIKQKKDLSDSEIINPRETAFLREPRKGCGFVVSTSRV